VCLLFLVFLLQAFEDNDNKRLDKSRQSCGSHLCRLAGRYNSCIVLSHVLLRLAIVFPDGLTVKKTDTEKCYDLILFVFSSI